MTIDEKSVTPTEISSKDYSNQNLSFQSFKGQNLEGSNFFKCNLKNSDFSNCNLKNCNFRESDLTETNFSNSDMRGADFLYSNTSRTIFANAQLWDNHSIKITTQQILQTNLKEIQLLNILWSKLDLTGKNLERANLSFSSIMGGDHRNAILTGANLEGIRIYNSDMKNVDLSSANLKNADFSYCDLSGANLSSAIIDGANFRGATMIGTTLTGIDKSKANFAEVLYEPKVLSDKESQRQELFDLIKTLDRTCSITINANQFQIFSEYKTNADVNIEIEAVEGNKDFARLISGGNFTFIDSDSPQYDISIRFSKRDVKNIDLFARIIRQSFPQKFKIFPSEYSIGAYWITDEISEQKASSMLKQILQNYVSDVLS